jgi:hypothetical protein
MRSFLLCVSSAALMLAACAPAATPAPAATQPPPAISTTAPTAAAVEPTTVPTEVPAAATENPTEAPTEALAPTATPTLFKGTFVQQEVTGTGGFTLDPATGELKLSADFSVPSGPDLFVILSGATEVQLDYRQFSAQVLTLPKLNLAPLQSVQGAQTYQIPAGTDLSQYNSVIVWCETYSVAFIAALIER